MKFCPRCKQTLALDAFGVSRASRDGKASYCRSCQGAYQIEYRLREAPKRIKTNAPPDGPPRLSNLALQLIARHERHIDLRTAPEAPSVQWTARPVHERQTRPFPVSERRDAIQSHPDHEDKPEDWYFVGSAMARADTARRIASRYKIIF